MHVKLHSVCMKSALGIVGLTPCSDRQPTAVRWNIHQLVGFTHKASYGLLLTSPWQFNTHRGNATPPPPIITPYSSWENSVEVVAHPELAELSVSLTWFSRSHLRDSRSRLILYYNKSSYLNLQPVTTFHSFVFFKLKQQKYYKQAKSFKPVS